MRGTTSLLAMVMIAVFTSPGLATDPAVDDANGDLDGDGYRNLEEYLNGTAAPDGERPPARPRPPFLFDS